MSKQKPYTSMVININTILEGHTRLTILKKVPANSSDYMIINLNTNSLPRASQLYQCLIFELVLLLFVCEQDMLG